MSDSENRFTNDSKEKHDLHLLVLFGLGLCSMIAVGLAISNGIVAITVDGTAYPYSESSVGVTISATSVIYALFFIGVILLRSVRD